MKFRLSNVVLLVVLLTAVVAFLLSLDKDQEVLLKAGIVNRQPAIVINQLGYLPQGQKIALFRQSTATDFPQSNPDTAELINRDRHQPIATLSLQPRGIDLNTGDRLAEIDFSSITQPGTYYLRAKRYQSAPFTIGTDIYQQPLITMLRSYYLQRCGVAIDDPVTGITHAPCHLQDGAIAHPDQYHPAGEIFKAVGGWHDSGSYSKYVATTSVTIGDLLSLYEQNPALFPDHQLEIPESSNGRSDLLDEMEFGLNWLLKMQREDGAVYRKLSGKRWPLDLAPDEDTQPRYIFGISTPETAKFAAVMAIASRTFADQALTARYLTAAKLAWQYLQTQPQMRVNWIEGDDSGSDQYLGDQDNLEESLTTDVDDRLWAAIELSITTGQPEFAQYIAENLDSVAYTSFEWKNPAPLGMINYLRQKRQGIDSEVAQRIKTKIINRADLLLNQVKQSTYGLANDRFIWGSNRLVAQAGITLIHAYQLTQNIQYRNAAISQLDYLLGRNHFNQTFITDVGTNSVRNLSNLYTRAKGIKFPGLVVAGANSQSPDGKVLQNRDQLSYADDELSYATNGSATDYNASVISLMVNLMVSFSLELKA